MIMKLLETYMKTLNYYMIKKEGWDETNFSPKKTMV